MALNDALHIREHLLRRVFKLYKLTDKALVSKAQGDHESPIPQSLERRVVVLLNEGAVDR